MEDCRRARLHVTGGGELPRRRSLEPQRFCAASSPRPIRCSERATEPWKKTDINDSNVKGMSPTSVGARRAGDDMKEVPGEIPGIKWGAKVKVGTVRNDRRLLAH